MLWVWFCISLSLYVYIYAYIFLLFCYSHASPSKSHILHQLCLNIASTLPQHCLNLASALPQPCLNLPQHCLEKHLSTRPSGRKGDSQHFVVLYDFCRVLLYYRLRWDGELLSTAGRCSPNCSPRTGRSVVVVCDKYYLLTKLQAQVSHVQEENVEFPRLVGSQFCAYPRASD